MSRAQERRNQEQVESGEAGQAEQQQQPEEDQTFQAVDAGDQDGEVKDYQPNDAEGDRVSAHGNAVGGGAGGSAPRGDRLRPQPSTTRARRRTT
jgi:hypothetical protein